MILSDAFCDCAPGAAVIGAAYTKTPASHSKQFLNKIKGLRRGCDGRVGTHAAYCLIFEHLLYSASVIQTTGLVMPEPSIKDGKIAFPQHEVEACIREALAEQVSTQGTILPHAKKSSRPWEPEIDSLVVVEIMCAVEELLNVKLPATFAPKGGYASTEACVKELVSQAKAAWHDTIQEPALHEHE
jgi:acyl carrier protein